MTTTTGHAAAALPAPAPLVNPETAPFWQATTEATLLLKRCDDCERVIWYPRSMCPHCGSLATSSFAANGLGTIYSFAINRRGVRWYAESEATPYVIGYVELDEGVRVLTNIVDCDPERIEIGQRVHVVFHDTGEGSALYRFRPVG